MSSQWDHRQYTFERNSEHRTFARDHSYPEWVWMKRWEAGEIDNPAPTPQEVNRPMRELLNRIQDSKELLAEGEITPEHALYMIERQAERVRL